MRKIKESWDQANFSTAIRVVQPHLKPDENKNIDDYFSLYKAIFRKAPVSFDINDCVELSHESYRLGINKKSELINTPKIHAVSFRWLHPGQALLCDFFSDDKPIHEIEAQFSVLDILYEWSLYGSFPIEEIEQAYLKQYAGLRIKIDKEKQKCEAAIAKFKKSKKYRLFKSFFKSTLSTLEDWIVTLELFLQKQCEHRHHITRQYEVSKTHLTIEDKPSNNDVVLRAEALLRDKTQRLNEIVDMQHDTYTIKSTFEKTHWDIHGGKELKHYADLVMRMRKNMPRYCDEAQKIDQSIQQMSDQLSASNPECH